MKKSSHIAILIVTLVGIIAGLAFMNRPAPHKGITIGALLPLTGKLANFGEDIRNGLELTRAQILAESGIDIKISYEDSGGEPRLALPAAQKLVNADGLDIIISGPGSSGNMAVAPFAEKSKAVFIVLSATPKLNTAGEYVFKIIPDIDEEMVLAAKRLTNEGAKTVSFIYDSSADSNVVGKEVFIEQFMKFGGQKVYAEGYDTKMTNDFRSIFTKAKGQKPDALFFLGTDIAGGTAIPQAREVGITKQIYGWSAMESETFSANAGKAAEGVIFTSFPFSCDDSGDVGKFCSDYQKAFRDRRPIHYAAHAHDLLNIIRYVILENKDPGMLKDEIRAALTSKSYSGISGKLTFNALGNVEGKDFVFKTVRDGKFIRID